MDMTKLLDYVKSMKTYKYLEFKAENGHLWSNVGGDCIIYSGVDPESACDRINGLPGRTADVTGDTLKVISFLPTDCPIPSKDDVERMYNDELTKNNHIMTQNVRVAIYESIKALKTSAKVSIYRACLPYITVDLAEKGYKFTISDNGDDSSGKVDLNIEILTKI